MSEPPCFKAYDIRGRMPDELNPDIAWRIGRATAEYLKPKAIVVGKLRGHTTSGSHLES